VIPADQSLQGLAPEARRRGGAAAGKRPVTAVVFDYFGTLTPATPSHVWDEHAARSAAPLGLAPAVWRAALDGSFGERVTGRLGDLPATLRVLAGRTGIEPSVEAIGAACAARRAAQRELFVLRPGAMGVLAELRARGLRLGVLSDCTVELAEAWPGLPVCAAVDARVLSCEAGRRKPDPELFLMSARELRVAPEDCLYVGDGAGGELHGASLTGMRAVLLRAADRDGQPGRPHDAGWAGQVVPSLAAIIELV
jgi:putative hydrolase of the HAD superfamily